MDNRLSTFLKLCETMNYRKTAELLNLSQPAVTKQIQSLEEEFAIDLFNFDGKKLHRSEESYILEKFAVSQKCSYLELEKALEKDEKKLVRIGMTKTIGIYGVIDEITSYLSRSRDNIRITIANTERLLKMLKDNEVNFVLIEGNFDKRFYEYKLISEEVFTGFCPKDHKFAGKGINISDIFSQRLICREKGSGSRNILENQLHYNGHRLEDFDDMLVVNSTSLIEKLVEAGNGISFGYNLITRDNPQLENFTVKGITSWHEFNIVSIKNTNGLNLARKFLMEKYKLAKDSSICHV